MKRGAVAAMLAVIMLLCGGACVAGAAGAVLPPDSPKESPWFSEVLHQSARGSRDLLGLPVDPSMVKREIQRLADRLRPEVSRAVDEDQIVDAFRRVLLTEEGFVYDKSSSDPGNYLLETVLARKRGTAWAFRCSTFPSRIGWAFPSAECTFRPTVSSAMKGKRSGGTSSSPRGAPTGRTSSTGKCSGSVRRGRTC